MELMKGNDAIVHTAALHGIHKGKFSDHDFLDVNVIGTYNVLNVAYKLGIKKVIYTSSTSVYGASKSNIKEEAIYINEDTIKDPIDINDVTKANGELLVNYFNKEYRMNCISLRIGRFFKSGDVFNDQLAKLHGGIDILDVVQGIKAALLLKDFTYNTFCLSSYVPFSKDDLKSLIGNASQKIEEYYPGATELFRRRGYELPDTVHRVVDISRARKVLGFEPKFNFHNFLNDLKGEADLVNL